MRQSPSEKFEKRIKHSKANRKTLCVFRELEERDAQPSANISILHSLFKVFIQKVYYNNNLGPFFFFTKRGEGGGLFIHFGTVYACMLLVFTCYTIVFFTLKSFVTTTFSRIFSAVSEITIGHSCIMYNPRSSVGRGPSWMTISRC